MGTQSAYISLHRRTPSKRIGSMRTLVGSLLVAALLAGDVVGCAATSEDESSGSEDAFTEGGVSIDESGNGRTFTVEKGKDVKLVLPMNPTTGYKWKVVNTTRTFGYPTPRD